MSSEELNPASSLKDLKLYGERTGQSIRTREPDKYQAIVRSLKNGLSLRQCAEVFSISKNTAGAICVRELGPGGMRKATEDNLRLLAHKASTDLLHDMDKISPAQKGVIMGIVLDKLERSEERQSQPTSLTQNNININAAPNITPEAVKEFFDSLGGGAKTIDIPTIDRKEHEPEDNH